MAFDGNLNDFTNPSQTGNVKVVKKKQANAHNPDPRYQTVDEGARAVPADSVTKTRQSRKATKRDRQAQPQDSQAYNENRENQRKESFRKKLASRRSFKTVLQGQGILTTPARVKAIATTARIIMTGPGYAYVFIQLPFGLLSAVGFSAELSFESIPLVGSIVSYIIPGEMVMLAGIAITLIVVICTVIYALIMYKTRGVSSLPSFGALLALVFAVGCSVVPGVNALPLLLLWVFIVIKEAGNE